MFKSWIKDLMEADIEVPSTNLKKLVKKAVNRKDNNIDGFVDKEDPKGRTLWCFYSTSKKYTKKL
jgi:hypothetical protein